MMALGSFRFGMRNDACQRFSHSAAWRWNKLDRIGREPALQYLGPDTLTITARAADMTGSIRARKTRARTDVTIADIVAKIAAEEGLEAQVSDSLKTRFHAWLAQTSERRSECPHPAGPRPRCDRQARGRSAAVP